MNANRAADGRFDPAILRDMFWFNASLGVYRCVKGIDYVRTIEFPVAALRVLSELRRGGDYLDVGSGDSILPTYIMTRASARVTALDKFDWVKAQYRYAKRLKRAAWLDDGTFSVVQDDFLRCSCFESSAFDVISAVSVLEHMDGSGDSEAVVKAFDLLRPGGLLFVSCPYNHTQPQDFRVAADVYGERGGTHGAFFQRHYSGETFEDRIVRAAPFAVEDLFYAGHYDGFDFARHLYIVDWPWKAAKVLYNWAAPLYAPHFLKVSGVPPSDPDPQMLAADTVFAVLRKPGA
jgi:SAM-dependent methyltransferase